MKKTLWAVMAAALCLLLLAGCGTSETPPTSPTPTPSETSAATEILGFPIDEYHNAFYVGEGDENGRTPLVTAAWENGAWQLSVWEAPELTQPIQTMTVSGSQYDRMSFAADVNFDSYTDFGYGAAEGVVNSEFYTIWLWDEAQGQFVESPECSALCNPQFDAVTGTVSSYVHRDAGAFTKEFYRWQDGKLYMVRRVAVDFPSMTDENGILTVTDQINETLQEVCREEFTGDGVEEAARWYDLAYHGT